MIPSKQDDDSTSSTTNMVINLPFESGFRKETIRRLLKTTSVKCNCWCCLDTGIQYDYEVLAEEIKSTQKSIAGCRQDTNKILGKIAKLESFFQ